MSDVKENEDFVVLRASIVVDNWKRRDISGNRDDVSNWIRYRAQNRGT